MNKEEVIAYIASKIKKNETGAITAEVLADVLTKIAEMDVYEVKALKINGSPSSGDDLETGLSKMGITEQQFDDLCSGKYGFINISGHRIPVVEFHNSNTYKYFASYSSYPSMSGCYIHVEYTDTFGAEFKEI